MTGEVILWLSAFVVLVIVEFATMQFVSMWFAGGAFVSLILAACGIAFWLQALVFVLVSGILLIFTRPIVKKLMLKGIVPTNGELDIGKTALVIEEINNTKSIGRVNLSGVDWSARSSNGEDISEGSTVKVDKIDGTKLYVSL